MALTLEEKALLIRKYEPHLVFRFLKDFGKQYIAAPIDPDIYIRKCGFWADTAPDQPEKSNWGMSAAGHQEPNVEPGLLEAEPFLVGSKTRLKDALADALGAGASSGFLSLGGWLEQSPFEPANINPDIPEAGLVTAETRNMLGHLHHGGQFWTQRAFANDPVPFPGAEGEPKGDPFVSPPRYTAEAFDFEEAFNWPALQPVKDTLNDVSPFLNGGEVYYLWYHYFFPTHDDMLTRCEMITLMQTLGVELPDADKDWFREDFEEAVASGVPVNSAYSAGLESLIESLKEEGAHFSLPFASYLGDFVSVAVVVRAPRVDTGGPLPSPLDVSEDLFQPPLFVGFGTKTYAVDVTPHGAPVVQKPLVEVFSGDQIVREGLHALAFVSVGTNNTYKGSDVNSDFDFGQAVRRRDHLLPTLCEVADVDGDTTVPHTGEKKRRYRATVLLAKIGAGIASGGGLGVVIGAAAALFELIADADDDREPSLEGLGGSSDGIANGVEGNFIIRSEDARSDFGDSDKMFTYWPDDTASMVIDSADPPDWFRQPSLRFGVPSLTDPFHHRSGKAQPEFLLVTIQALATKLAQGQD